MDDYSPVDEDATLVPAGNYGDALGSAVARLRAARATESPELDAQVLLAHVTGASRAAVLAYPERTLTARQSALYARLIERRVAHEPVAYLTGHREFMGLDYLTDRRALIPRPETELLVEAALTEIRRRLSDGPPAVTPIVADIGTGSGAIAVAVAVHEPRVPRIYATDMSADALALAAENARRHHVSERITFVRGDLLAPLPEPVDVLLANLPYVAPHAAPTLALDVGRYEPELALYGDDDGLGHFRRFFASAPAHLRPDAAILLEFGYDQRSALETLAHSAFPHAEIAVGADYAGWDRYVIVRTHTP